MESDEEDSSLTESQVRILAGSQAHKKRPNDPTSQITTTTSNILLEKVRRRQSTQPRRLLPTQSQPDQPRIAATQEYRTHVFSTLKSRLTGQNIDTSGMTPATIAWSLPTDGANKDLWDDLLAEPMFLSDVKLQQLIKLRYSKKLDPAPADGHCVFYIRSYCFTVGELTAVITSLLQQEDVIPKAEAWLQELQGRGENTPIWLRYCGMTATTSPWTRYSHDKRSVTNPRQRVLKAAETLFPAITDSVTIWEVEEAETDFLVDQSVNDLRERVLIALLGFTTLLNTLPGGARAVVHPSRHVAFEIEKLGFRTHARIREATQSCGSEASELIAKYSSDCKEYANKNPSTTGTAKHPFSDEYQQTVYDQALPAQMKALECTPFLTVGHDPTIDSFTKCIPFFKTTGPTKEIVTSVINTFVTFEGPQMMEFGSPAVNLFESKLLPFIDLYQWTKKSNKDLPAALGLVRQYLRAAKPLIVLTWGYDVSTRAFGNFTHSNGIRQNDMKDRIGTWKIIKYSEPLSSTRSSGQVADADDYAIVIPSYHPNCVSYGGFDPHAFIDIFSMTMAVAWLAIDIALDLVANNSSPSASTKLDLCRAIEVRLNTQIGEGTVFADEFDKARQKLKETTREKLWTKHDSRDEAADEGSKSQSITEEEEGRKQTIYFDTGKGELQVRSDTARWKRARDQLYMIALCNYATTPRSSNDRKIEVGALLEKNVAELEATFVAIDSEMNLQEYLEDINMGASFYLEAASVANRRRDIPDLLGLFINTSQHRVDPNDPDWVLQDDVLQKASEDLETWVVREVFPAGLSAEKVSQRVIVSLNELMEEKDRDLYQSMLRNKMKQPMRKGTEKRPAKPNNEFPDADAAISGSAVSIFPSSKHGKACGQLDMRWRSNTGEFLTLSKHQTPLKMPAAVVPLYEDEARYIFFTDEGVDIRDSEGQSLGRKEGPTIPLRDVHLQLKEPVLGQFLELWSRETGKSPEDAVFASRKGSTGVVLTDVYYPEEVFQQGSRGNKEINFGTGGKSLKEDLERNRMQASFPIQAGDAYWLLHKFLEEEYPNGGEADVSNPNTFPHANTLWRKLRNFVQQPKYQHHPMVDNVINLIDTATASAVTSGCDAAIKVALTFLRPPATRVVKRVAVPGGGRKNKTVYELGQTAPAHVVPVNVDPELSGTEVEEILEDLAETESEVVQAGGSSLAEQFDALAKEDAMDVEEEVQPRSRSGKKTLTSTSEATTTDPPLRRSSRVQTGGSETPTLSGARKRAHEADPDSPSAASSSGPKRGRTAASAGAKDRSKDKEGQHSENDNEDDEMLLK